MRRFRPFAAPRFNREVRPQGTLHYGVNKWQGRGRIADLRSPLPHPIRSTRCPRARHRQAVSMHYWIAERASEYSVIPFLSECITRPGHEPWITRPFGWHHHGVFNAQSRGGESIKPGHITFVVVTAGLVSVGPSSEAR